jgi:RsiW-degrading membrane proteinase PrsW (M82 family)
MDALYLLAIALAPGVAITMYIYLKDKHEREPLYLLLTCFLYGILATFLTLVISRPVNMLLLLRDDDVVDQAFNALFKVALVEELSKFIFVRFFIFNKKEFNEPFDGIVYATMVGMGFATLENIVYVYNYGYATGLLRMFTAVPGHATFAIMMGYFIGQAKFIRGRNLYYAILALAAPTLFHGLYDYFWFIAEVKDVWAGVWIFAILSLVVGVMLSRRAIRLHQQASPFIEAREKIDSDPPTVGL